MNTAVSVSDTMYGLEIEVLIDGSVGLEADAGSGEVERIMLHPAQLRWIAESAGLLRAPATPDLQAPSIPELERTITRLQRSLLCIRDRTETLFKNICISSDMGHEDLTTEVAQCAALTDIIELACGEFLDDYDISPRVAYGKQPKAESSAAPAADQSPKATNQSSSATGSPGVLVAQGDYHHPAAPARSGSRTGAAPKAVPKLPIGDASGPLFAEDGGPQP